MLYMYDTVRYLSVMAGSTLLTQEIEELATLPQISSQQINLVCIRLNSELRLAEVAISSHQH